MDDGSGAAAGTALLFLLLLYAAMIVFAVYVYVRIARKAGFPGWYAVLLFVPLVNVVVGIMFAFVEWPVEREVKELRARLAHAGPAAMGGPAVFGQLPQSGWQYGDGPQYGQQNQQGQRYDQG